MEKILAIFSLKEKESVGKFTIYGEYEMKRTNIGSDNYEYLDFFNTKAKINKNDVISDYSPEGCNWYGKRYTCKDMLQDLNFDMMIGGDNYTVEYLEPKIKELIASYCADSVEIGQPPIPKRILRGSLSNLYKLLLVTDKYIYYCYEDSLIMIDKDTREMISDNYFAEVGYLDSQEAIENGEEKKLWSIEDDINLDFGLSL